jgi:hypothetical protein
MCLSHIQENGEDYARCTITGVNQHRQRSHRDSADCHGIAWKHNDRRRSIKRLPPALYPNAQFPMRKDETLTSHDGSCVHCCCHCQSGACPERQHTTLATRHSEEVDNLKSDDLQGSSHEHQGR